MTMTIMMWTKGLAQLSTLKLLQRIDRGGESQYSVERCYMRAVAHHTTSHSTRLDILNTHTRTQN